MASLRTDWGSIKYRKYLKELKKRGVIAEGYVSKLKDNK